MINKAWQKIGGGQLGHRALKLTVSHEGIDGINCFLHYVTNVD